MEHDHKLAKEEAAAWMAAARAMESSVPGVFARMEEALLEAKAPELDLKAAWAVSNSLRDRLRRPEDMLATMSGSRPDEGAALKERQAVSSLTQQIATLGNFRFSQQVISVSPAVSEMLSDQSSGRSLHDMAGQPVPVDVLGRLPFNTFVVVPNYGGLQSFLVHLERPDAKGDGRLMLHIDARITGADGKCARVVTGTILEPGKSLIDTLARLDKQYKSVSGSSESVGDWQLAASVSVMASALPYLLYLAADNRDLDSEVGPLLLNVTTTKRGPRIFPPEKPTFVAAGVRIGAAIESYRAQVAAGDDAGISGAMPPHLRRAHWHVFWKGPRDEPQLRHRVLHFLPPIPVNIARPGEMETSVRPMRQRTRP